MYSDSQMNIYEEVGESNFTEIRDGSNFTYPISVLKNVKTSQLVSVASSQKSILYKEYFSALSFKTDREVYNKTIEIFADYLDAEDGIKTNFIPTKEACEKLVENYLKMQDTHLKEYRFDYHPDTKDFLYRFSIMLFISITISEQQRKKK